jgi:dipeptidyl aminopeptidase/acylaminoacyl peptidase
MLENATGLTWVDPQRVMFSEIKSGWHFAIVTSTESRSEERDVYVPPRETDMAHNSYLSPDGNWVLATEMRTTSFVPCRLVPFKGGEARPVGPQNGGCTSAAWSPDGKWMYFTSDSGGHGSHIWRQGFPDGTPQQITRGPTEEAGIAMAPDGHSFITSVGTEQSNVWIHDEHGDRQISSEGYATNSVLSPDGTKLFYLLAPSSSEHWHEAGGELWVHDFTSGQGSRVLPGIAVIDFNLSPDGKRVVFETRDERGKRRLWLASLDHRFAPKLISANSGESNPIYAASGRIYFRASEGDAEFLYRMNEDGSRREKVVPEPVLLLFAVSPDERFVEALRPIKEEEATTGVEAIPLEGGPAIRICSHFCGASWSRDGKVLYLSLPGMKATFSTYVIPLAPGVDLPPLPAKGVFSENDLPKHSSLSGVDDFIHPGPNSSLYSFSRVNAHWNLYRVPIQ